MSSICYCVNYWLFFSQATPTLLPNLYYRIVSTFTTKVKALPRSEKAILYYKISISGKKSNLFLFLFFNVWKEKSKIDGKLSSDVWNFFVTANWHCNRHTYLGSFTYNIMKLFSLWTYIVVGLASWIYCYHVLLLLKYIFFKISQHTAKYLRPEVSVKSNFAKYWAISSFLYNKTTSGLSQVGVGGGLADQLTLYQPGRRIMPTILLHAPPDFQTFLRPCT